MVQSEDELCGQLAAHFCASRCNRLRFENIPSSDKFLFALVRAGFLVPKSPESDWAGPFKPAVEVERFPEFAAQSLHLTSEDKQELLASAITHAGDCLDVPVTRAWFKIRPKKHLLQASRVRFMEIMVQFDYAEQGESRYRWTDRIAPAMQASYFWDHQGSSLDSRGK